MNEFPLLFPLVVESAKRVGGHFRYQCEFLETGDDLSSSLSPKKERLPIYIVRPGNVMVAYDEIQLRIAGALREATNGTLKFDALDIPSWSRGAVQWLPSDHSQWADFFQSHLSEMFEKPSREVIFVDSVALEKQDGLAELMESISQRVKKLSSEDVTRARAHERMIRQQTERATQRRDELLNSESWRDHKEVAVFARGGVVESNESEYASRLRREGRLLGAKVRGAFKHPSFQFRADGSVIPEMEQVLAILPNDDYGWAAVFWFFQPSGHLTGRRPADVFREDPHSVIGAAEKDFVRRDDEF